MAAFDRYIRAHGTDDFNVVGQNHVGGTESLSHFTYLQSARLLKTIWDLGFTDPTYPHPVPVPSQNAHSISSAALGEVNPQQFTTPDRSWSCWFTDKGRMVLYSALWLHRYQSLIAHSDIVAYFIRYRGA